MVAFPLECKDEHYVIRGNNFHFINVEYICDPDLIHNAVAKFK